MTANELESLKAVLGEIDRIPPVVRREVNFFDVGGRGHLENPTSDLMALFMGSKHGVFPWLGKALLEWLMEIKANQTINSDGIDWTRITVEREVSHPDKDSGTKKRLDIVFGNEDFVVGIENKVHAGAESNPFQTYSDLLNELGESKKAIYSCVLSASSQRDDVRDTNWPIVSYQQLVGKARDLYGRDVASTPINKWHFLYQELLAHLEQLGTQSEDIFMDENTKKVVEENYSTLLNVPDLLKDFFAHVQTKGKNEILKALGGERYEVGITTGQGNYDAGKALTFTWGGELHVALVLLKPKVGDRDKYVKYQVRTYINRATCPTANEIKKQFAAGDNNHPFPSSLKIGTSWLEREEPALVLTFSPTKPGLDAAICGLGELAGWVNKVAYSESS